MTHPAYRSGISVRQQPRDPFLRAVPKVRIRFPPAESRANHRLLVFNNLVMYDQHVNVDRAGSCDKLVVERRSTPASHGTGTARRSPRMAIPSPSRRSKDRENCLLYDLYSLYSEIRIAAGERPGIAGPLYRFTKECMGLLGEHLRISEPSFRMRIQRVKNNRLQGIGSLASAL